MSQDGVAKALYLGPSGLAAGYLPACCWWPGSRWNWPGAGSTASTG